MKRVMVVVAIVMVLTLALSAGTASAAPGWGMGFDGQGFDGNRYDGNRYIVRPGDTLDAIAFRFHVNTFELARLNGITNPNLIFVGQKLMIPSQKFGPRPIYNQGPFDQGCCPQPCEQQYCQPYCEQPCYDQCYQQPCYDQCYQQQCVCEQPCYDQCCQPDRNWGWDKGAEWGRDGGWGQWGGIPTGWGNTDNFCPGCDRGNYSLQSKG